MQQINVTENVDSAGNTIMVFNYWGRKQNRLDFSQETLKVL